MVLMFFQPVKRTLIKLHNQHTDEIHQKSCMGLFHEGAYTASDNARNVWFMRIMSEG